jgi:hypothetical protein
MFALRDPGRAPALSAYRRAVSSTTLSPSRSARRSINVRLCAAIVFCAALSALDQRRLSGVATNREPACGPSLGGRLALNQRERTAPCRSKPNSFHRAGTDRSPVANASRP